MTISSMKPIENPPNPFESHFVEYFEGIVPPARLEVFRDTTRGILSRNDSPDLGFRWSVNPYRGCFHGCAYCYARPSHEYLGFGAGSDFETRIVVKEKAPELLRAAFLKPSWKGELVVFSGDTDCYQPLEACYQLTRRCLEVCLEFGNPVGIVTKSFLITRDVELLKKLHERTHVSLSVSIPFFDERTARVVEPNAASIRKRFEAVRILAEAGLPVGILVAPIIPGLNDSDIPQILKEAKACGARSASPVLLRLPGSVKQVFISRIEKQFPLQAEKILHRIREVREGKLSNPEFHERHIGTGPYWENIERIFEVYSQKYGLNRNRPTPDRPPSPARPRKRNSHSLPACDIILISKEGVMADILIRGIPLRVRHEIQRLAARKNLSVNQFLVERIMEMVKKNGDQEVEEERRKKAFRRIREIREELYRKFGLQDDSTKIIRHFRDTRNQ